MAVLDLARELVKIPSHDDETAAGDFIEDWLRSETDGTVTRDEHGNVIARRGSGRSLAVVGHHDVVPPSDNQLQSPDQYQVDVRDDRLYGRGAADMKGAVAAAMIAFRDAAPADELIFASFVGEELGGTGARGAIEAGFSPDVAIVGEGTTGYSAPGVTDIAPAHRGRRGSVLTATGSVAHASEPDEGINAIYRATDAIDVVRELTPGQAEVLNQEISGSLVVTKIEGGEAWNQIPGTCQVTIDERTVPGARANLERVESIEGVEWTIEQDLPPMRCENESFRQAVLTAATAHQRGEPELVIKPHATDAGWLSKAGVDCIVCGPAEIGEAHTANESVSIEVLDRCEQIYRLVAETWP